jgi:hypothetical protein
MALPNILYNEILRMRDQHLAKDERVLTAKILVKKVLLGFYHEWKTYSDCNKDPNSEVLNYDRFIYDDNRLLAHYNRFIDVSNEIRAINILPDRIPEHLIELATRMQWFSCISVTHDDWSREDPGSIPSVFDALVNDAYGMYENFDDYCN